MPKPSFVRLKSSRSSSNAFRARVLSSSTQSNTSFSAPVKVILNGLPGEVLFAVCNEGPKIDPSILARIFEPLRRGLDEQYVTGTDGSMGFGLYIAREITTAHGGQSTAKSDETQTAFTVWLPRLNSKSA